MMDTVRDVDDRADERYRVVKQSMNRWRERQSGLVTERQLGRYQVVIAGVGAIGRQVALQLACMGVRRLVLIDPDVVEDVNVGAQMYAPQDIGSSKVEVTGRDCRKWLRGEGIGLEMIQENLPGDDDERWIDICMDVVFCCVDSMRARKEIYELAARWETKLFMDIRVEGEVMRLFCVPMNSKKAKRWWEENWFPDEEARQGSCTTRMTIYSAYVASGLMVAKYMTWMRRNKGFELPVEIHVDLLGSYGTAVFENEVE